MLRDKGVLLVSKIAIIGSVPRSLLLFRGELIQEWVKEGHQVVALASPATVPVVEELRELGARFVPLPWDQMGLNPFNELQVWFQLYRELQREQPDIFFLYTVKPVIYASLLAPLLGWPRIFSMITGLGYAFSDASRKQRVLKAFLRPLYKRALRKNEAVFFQNPDDLALFESMGIMEREKAVLVNGSGVNLERFSYTPPPLEPLSFLLVARLIRSKGIEDFVHAAALVREQYPQVRFRLLGPFVKGGDGIREESIRRWEREGKVEYLGRVEDVRPHLAASSVFVLPSYYREGIPRSTLEAMAMGRSVITTDAPGCRETVEHGRNGFLVPVKDVDSLARAMLKLVKCPSMVVKMGKESRKIAENKYDVCTVNNKIVEKMRS